MSDVNNVLDPKLIIALEKVNAEIIEAGTNVDKLIPSLNKLADIQKELGKNTNFDAEAQEKLIASQKEAEKVQKQLIKTEAKINSLSTDSAKLLTAQKLKLQELTKAGKDKLKYDQAAEGSLVRMRQKLSALTKTYDASGTRTKEAAKEIRNLSKEIGAAEEATNRHQRGVGGYREQLDGMKVSVMNGTTSFAQMKSGIIGVGKAALTFLLSPVGLVIGLIGGLILAGKALIKNAQGFEKAASSLSAITGQVGEDLDFMKEKAIEFSKSSLSSAEDILGAFEKVGSAMPALLQNGALLTEVTKNALTLSEATGGKLSVEDAAKAAAGAMNQFNIPLTESAKTVNILAAGSLAGSADILSLSESLKNVGAVASGADLSLEQTVGLLEVLGEKSLFGTEAGTKLRGSILKLQKAGLGYTSGIFNMKDALEEANGKIEEQGDALERDAYMQKIFGAENITAGKILLSNIDKYDQLTAAVTGTNTAFDQQGTQMNNLEGSYAKLNNLWKAFMLGFEDGNGLFAKVWKGLIDFSSAFIDGMIQWQQAFTSFFEMFESKKTKAEKRARKEEKDRLAAIEAEKQAEIDAAAIQKKIDDEKLIVIKEKADAEKLASDDQKKIDDDEAKRVADNLKAFLDGEKLKKSIKDGTNKDIASAEKALDSELKGLDKEFWDEVNENAFEGFNEGVKLIEEEVEAVKKANKDKIASDKEKEEEDKKAHQDKLDRIQELADYTLNASQQGFDIAAGFNARALQDIEARQAKELEDELLTSEQKKAIDEKYALEKAKINKKQAIADKAQALFNIAINTAVAISKVIGQTGIFGLAAWIPIAALGALQASAVLANPIPAFEKGTSYAPGGVSELAEKGVEMVKNPDGKIWLAENRGLYNLQQGAEVLTHKETVAELKSFDIVNELKLTRKAINNIPQPVFKNGSKIRERRANYWKNYIKSKHQYN